MRILVTLIALTTLFACGNKNQFVLNGEIIGVDKDQIVLGKFDRETLVLIGIDTTEVVGGKFTFEREMIKTRTYTLKLIENNISFAAILENGDITIGADIKDTQSGFIQNVNIEGADNQILSDQFFNMKSEVLNQNKYANCKKLAGKLKSAKGYYELVELNEQLNKLAPSLENEVKVAQLELIRNNIDKYFILEVFPFLERVGTGEQIKEIYALLPESSKQHASVVNMMKDVKIKESIQPGEIAPDFTLKTPEGKDLSLFSLRGQLVLVDFWASWCKPCRASFPHMKELYKKYHSKGFEILGVTSDTNHKAWKKTIKDDGIPWLNVADVFPIKNKQARVIKEYGMDYLPSTVLIDKNGVIIAKLLHKEDLDKKLEELFSK